MARKSKDVAKAAIDALVAVQGAYALGMRHPDEQDALTVAIRQQRELIRAALVDGWERDQADQKSAAAGRAEAEEARIRRNSLRAAYDALRAAGVAKKRAIAEVAEASGCAESALAKWIQPAERGRDH